MDSTNPPLSTTSAIGDDKLDLPCPKQKDVLECHICFDPPTDPIAGSCGHIFCWPCMYKWLQDKPMPRCPVCRHNLRIDRNIIPLYGGGVSAEPNNSNDNEGSAAKSPAALDTAIPPRPNNPLLVSRLMIEHCVALRTRVQKLETERAIMELERSGLEHMNANLRRQVVEKDCRIFELERDGMMSGMHDLQQRNVPEVQENQATEPLPHIEWANQRREEAMESISDPPGQIPPWNAAEDDWLDPIFDAAY